jgi:hypothetical protein
MEAYTTTRDSKIFAPPQRFLHKSSCSGVKHLIKRPRQPSSLPQPPCYNHSNTSNRKEFINTNIDIDNGSSSTNKHSHREGLDLRDR